MAPPASATGGTGWLPLVLDWLAAGAGAAWIALFLLASFLLAVNAGLKLWTGALAFCGYRRLRAAASSGLPASSSEGNVTLQRAPVVSILVPLYRETDIAARLLARLDRLEYPRALLDICLVTEEADIATRRMLRRAALPPHMRVIVVPDGPIRTKPRALNFALDFCRGSIVGVYDAEDAPDPQQISDVVQRFANSDRRLACVQGVLDFYNAGTNWLSRCFTLEYAVWFRVVLPGFSRLGIPVPLGGTTVFFRREILERLGAWDAHNVTEDADLGIRLARHGYRTELIASVTREEANCRAWPWIRQRSRWLKGYAMTYRVHMRDPAALWRDLGPRGFLGFQALFLGTLLGFVTAPVLLSFWAVALGWPHPAAAVFPPGLLRGFMAGFVLAELISMGVGLLAAVLRGSPGLGGWAPTLHFYFPLASVAAFKALYELLRAPFYWDKTAHGIGEVSGPDPAAPGATGSDTTALTTLN